MNHNPGKIKRLLIVGGGLAGWMAAAYLNRFFLVLDVTITLVESIKLGTSGVGEGSGPALVQFVRDLKINEVELMQQCSATFKLGTLFLDWTQSHPSIGPEKHEPSSFWHPYGLCGGTINDIDLFHFWLKSLRAGNPEGPYSSFSLQALLAEQDKAPRPFQGPSPIMERGEYGYHFDAATFADVFRELATEEGVHHLFDDVCHVEVGERPSFNTPESSAGWINHVETTSGRKLSADLYLDCTPEGSLVEKGLGDPWISWADLFLCDREVILPLTRDPRIRPYTEVTALNAGWMWQVPLSHRVGCGYVYASGLWSDDAAVRELLVRATPDGACSAEPRFRKIRAGRRQKFWLGNCLALGPAAACTEPLETPDTLLLQKSLQLLVQHFPDSTCNPFLGQAYNRKVSSLHDGVRDFQLLHYFLSRKEDHPFWRQARNFPVPESLQTLLALHDEMGLVEAGAVFPEPSYHHLFAGAHRMPRRSLLAADSVDFAQVCGILEKMRAQNKEWLEKFPSHLEFMTRLHRPPV